MADKFYSLLGDDTTGTGSILSPYRTPTKALQNVGLGDVVYGRGGTYSNKVSNPTGITWGTQESERITFMPYDNEPITFKPGSGDHIFQLKGDIAYFTLQDIVFDGSSLDAGQYQMVMIWTQGVTDIINVVIDGNTFLESPDLAFIIESISDSCTFQNNTVLNAGRDDNTDLTTAAVYFRGSNHIIQDNVVGNTYAHAQSNPSVGIRYYTNSGDPGNNSTNGIVRRNYVYGVNTGIVVGTGANMGVYNNLIRDCDNVGVQVFSASGRPTDNCQIYHNTIVHPTGMNYGVRAIISVGAITNTDVQNNIIRRATTDVDLSADTGTPVNSTNYNGTSPGFANDGGTAVADYILTGAPVTVDAGADLRATVPTDYYGNTRDATPDQGFYEIVSPASPVISGDSLTSGVVNENIAVSSLAVNDENDDASIVYVDRRNNTNITLTFTAGTSTVEGGS